MTPANTNHTLREALAGSLAEAKPMKLCRDCKWCRKSWFPAFWDPYEFAKCARPTGIVNLVSGEQRRGSRWGYAEVERKPGLNDCGPDAVYWEPKP